MYRQRTQRLVGAIHKSETTRKNGSKEKAKLQDPVRSNKFSTMEALMSNSANLIPPPEVDNIESSTYFNSIFAPDSEVIDTIRRKICETKSSNGALTEANTKLFAVPNHPNSEMSQHEMESSLQNTANNDVHLLTSNIRKNGVLSSRKEEKAKLQDPVKTNKSSTMEALMSNSANLIPPPEVDIIESFTYFNSIFAPDSDVIDTIRRKICETKSSNSALTEANAKLFAVPNHPNSEMSQDEMESSLQKTANNEVHLLTSNICKNGVLSSRKEEEKCEEVAPSTSGLQLNLDLQLSSSESDPYDTDNDSRDPDYQQTSSENEESGTNSNKNLGEQTKTSKKRKRNTENWKRYTIKKKRNSGESYKNWKGNTRPRRNVKAPCENCRMKCSKKITANQRVLLFEEYWALGDINRQRDFIAKYVEHKRKMRQRKRPNHEDSTDVTSRRTFTCFYFLPIEQNKIQVCKTFFVNTLNISPQVVKTVFNKIGSAGVVKEDRRGKASKNNLLDETVKQSVKNHINSFETIESHYCRKSSSRLYLPATLNIAKMYTLYIEYCEENNIPRPATESMYREIFKNDFNLSFHHPKKDLCDICYKYQHSIPEERINLEIEYQNHIENKNLARDLKNSDKEMAQGNTQICAAVFDLQQILPVPKSEVGLAYYKLKLSTFNFTVFNLATKNCDCFMWYECVAKRGSSEIGSCLLMFILDHISKGINEFCFYSDNCAGQNRNKNLFSLYNYLSQKYNIIINHTYLERGHTQSEGDCVHSVIEKAARSVPIATPEQWYTLVRTAKRKQPYIVHEISQDSVFDLSDLRLKTTLNNEKDTAGERVNWNKIKIIKSSPDHPDCILLKYSYKQESFNIMNLLEKGRKKMSSITKQYKLKILYNKPIPLTKKKFDHLEFLCKKCVIGKSYHDFFRNLSYSQQAELNNDSDSE